MITCTVSNDKELLLSILKDKSVFKYISEDGLYYDMVELPVHMMYFIFKDQEELLGAAAIRPVTSVCAELHTCLLPSALGRSTEVFNTFASYLLNNTLLETLITLVPKYNKKAFSAAIKAGFKHLTTITGSYRKDNELMDQDLLQVIL